MKRIVSRGGFRQRITGGVEEEESLIEAAKRELNEETGFITTNLYAINYSYSFPIEDSGVISTLPGQKSLPNMYLLQK